MDSSSPPRRFLRWPVVGLLFLVCAAYVGPLFLGRTFGVRDHLLQTLPSRAFLGESLRAGHFPQWWDGVRLGERFAAEPNHGVAYPPAWIVGAVDPLWGADAILIGHVLLAGIGSLLFSRALGAGRVGAFLAGGAFMLSGYTTCMVVNGTIALPLAWLPFMGWAALRLAQATDGSDRLRRGLYLSLVMAAQVLAGNPAFLNAMPLCFLIVLIVARDRLRALLALGWSTALGTVMGAAALLPLFHTLRDSVRASGLSGDVGSIWSLHPARLVEWVWPFALGAGFREELGLARLFIPKGDGFFSLWSPSIYVGLPVLAGAVVALWRKLPHARWLGALALTYVLVALGRHTPVYAVYRTLYVPESFLRYPEKHLATALLLVCALAGLGMEALFARVVRLRGILWACLPAAGIGVALAGLYAFRASLVARLTDTIRATGRGILPAETVDTILRGGWAGLLIAALLPLTLLLARHARLGKYASHVLTAGTLLALLDHALATHITVSRDELRARPAILTAVPLPAAVPPRVAESPQAFSPMRISAEDRMRMVHHVAVANIPARFGMQPVPGYLEAGTPRFAAFLAASGKSNLGRIMDLLGVDYLITQAQNAATMGMPARSGPVAGMVLLQNSHARPRAFVAYRHVDTDGDARVLRHLLESPRADLDFGAIHLDRPSIVPESPGDPGACEISKPVPEHVILHCHAQHPGHAVLLDEWTRGWTATVDGSPAELLRADTVFRAVALPAGDHTIEMRYHTPGLRAGVLLTGLGCLVFLSLAVVSRRRQARVIPGAST